LHPMNSVDPLRANIAETLLVLYLECRARRILE
jgi:hypothetical protein